MNRPTNNFVNALLTDLYQLTMAYGYWKNGRHSENAVFDLFFRKNPFGGEFTIFAGLEEVLRYVSNFGFSDDDIKYLKEGPMKGCDPEFFEWLKTVDCSKIKISAVPEGTIVFPRLPLIRVEGPIAIAQLLETTLLNLVNYPSLIATNAARFRLAAGKDKTMLEFGLRRAQGPDGAMSASRYSYMGGFDGTSNVLAGKLFDAMVKGTHAHSYVSSFRSLKDLTSRSIVKPDGSVCEDFVKLVLMYREDLEFNDTNEGELAAFISYAQAFPNGFLALVDTYDTLKSGVPNFICVAMALEFIGYKPVGIRLDSGDLAYLSKEARDMFRDSWKKLNVDELESKTPDELKITASNDINEDVLHSLNQQGHEIDVFGVGTNLVTCQAQPALGCVYKLVEIEDNPRIKLSNQRVKITLPGKKTVERLVGKDGYPIADIIMLDSDKRAQIDERILCRDPFDETKRMYVKPSHVIPLHRIYWLGELAYDCKPLGDVRNYVIEQLKTFRPDHLRNTNPTPYKVSVSESLFRLIRELWEGEAPIEEIS